jgi:hypothetical protein
MSLEKYIGIFDEEKSFEKAIQSLKDTQVEIEEIFMPIPVHHAVRNVAGSSRLPTLAYFLGITSIIVTIAFLYYTAVISWPLNFGGKPSNAFPSFIVVTLVITIFLVTILSLLAFSVSAKIYPGKKAEVMHEKATDDKFVIVLNADRVSNAGDKLKQLGANEIIHSI